VYHEHLFIKQKMECSLKMNWVKLGARGLLVASWGSLVGIIASAFMMLIFQNAIWILSLFLFICTMVTTSYVYEKWRNS